MKKMLSFLVFALGCGAVASPLPAVSPYPLCAEPGKQGPEEKAFLGVVVESLEEFTRLHLGMEAGKGFGIREVSPESPAAKAGLKPGDVLVKLEQQVLFSATPLPATMSLFQPGQKIRVTFLRKGQEQNAEITLAGRIVDARPEGPRQPRPRFEIPFGMRSGEDRIEQMMRRLHRLEQDFGEGLLPPAMPAKPGQQMLIITEDADGRIELRGDKGDWHLKAHKPGGVLLFDGPWNRDEDKAKAPAELRQRADRLMKESALTTPDAGDHVL